MCVCVYGVCVCVQRGAMHCMGAGGAADDVKRRAGGGVFCKVFWGFRGGGGAKTCIMQLENLPWICCADTSANRAPPPLTHNC